MKHNTAANNPRYSEQVITDVAHLAWCALIALRLAQHEGLITSPLMVHTFLMHWLAVAQKQRRFPRSVAPDLEKLLRPGRLKGAAASLYQHLENLWHACSASLSYPSDLFRLTQAIQRLKAQNWLNTCAADPEWNIPALTAEYAGSSALLVKKSDLVRCFSEDGRLMGPVTFLARGNIIECINVMQAQGISTEAVEYSDGVNLLILLPAGEYRPSLV